LVSQIDLLMVGDKASPWPRFQLSVVSSAFGDGKTFKAAPSQTVRLRKPIVFQRPVRRREVWR
jgi:hypothetical protein